MHAKNRSRLAIAVTIFVMGALLVPATLAAGADSDPVVSGSSSVVLLTLGNQDRVEWETQIQPISTKKNDCAGVQFGTNPQLLVVTPIGGVLGEVKDGLGVQSAGDGSGEPCGRVEADDNEALSVSLGSALADHLMSAVDVDLELKFGASVRVTFLRDGALVATDPNLFDGQGSDDGPDSKDGDNYRYFHRPADNGSPVYFDTVVFTPVAGAISLEGGADLANNNAPNAFGQLDPSSKSSQFEVIGSFDGEITCGDVETIGNPALDPVHGVLSVHSMDFGSGWQVEDCLRKPFNSAVTGGALAFVPELEGTQARYTIEVTATDQPITVDGNGQITSLIAEYDPTGSLSFPDATTVPLQACLGQPVLGGDGYEAFWTQPDVGLLPSGESSCFYSASVGPTGENVGTELWGIYFEDDPAWSFK